MIPTSLDDNINICLKNTLVACRKDQAVALTTLNDGLTLLVYPEMLEFILGIGYSGDHPHVVRSDLVLRRRTADPGRFAPWIPSVTSNGTWLVLRHLKWSDVDCDDNESLRLEIATALELMS